VVVIPDAAVQRGPEGLFAYVVGANNKVELRQLAVGEIQDGRAVVRSGVRSGERVVTSGYYRLKPGSTVAPPKDSQQGVGQTTALGAGASGRTRSPEVE
jgi:multidrug efflux system membrane fusion protein